MMRRTKIDFHRVAPRNDDPYWEIQTWSGSAIYTLGIITDDAEGFTLLLPDPKNRGTWMPTEVFSVADFGTRRKAIGAAKAAARSHLED